ncbi:nucleotidyl transferase AbiEii/AbiGii toxin family protein [Mesorhizobium sp. M1B.F.Ca.ET.045.04.1.1]|nr:nucleotidyl transferase AbiEii/AbiGii toxin family protein [Mesorhizobium sp. M1B.F.Ca.ET.045.04.1.1]
MAHRSVSPYAGPRSSRIRQSGRSGDPIRFRNDLPDRGRKRRTGVRYERLSVEVIREGQQYGGVRVQTTASLGRTRIPVQVDIGFGDAVTPMAQELEFPSLLSAEGPRLRAYPRETVVAEKLQAIVVLGQANSRMKDFYDLLALSRLFAFECGSLVQAIRATFERRDTLLPTENPFSISPLQHAPNWSPWSTLCARSRSRFLGPRIIWKS